MFSQKKKQQPEPERIGLTMPPASVLDQLARRYAEKALTVHHNIGPDSDAEHLFHMSCQLADVAEFARLGTVTDKRE